MNINKWLCLGLFCSPINPLTTNDDYSYHRNSTACYQLMQSVLKIGSVLAERVGQGEVGGSNALADRAWWLLQLAVEKAWSVLDGPLLLSCTNRHRKRSFHFVGAPFLAY